MPTLLKLHEAKEKEQKSVYKEDGGTLKLKTSNLLHTIGVSTLEYKYINFVN